MIDTPAPAFYRLLLRAREFRERFGTEMEALFAEQLRAGGGSRHAWLSFWTRGIVGGRCESLTPRVLIHADREHKSTRVMSERAFDLFSAFALAGMPPRDCHRCRWPKLR